MNDLLKRVISFDKPANAAHVKGLIKQLGESPSLSTLTAVIDYYKAEKKQILSKDLLEWMQEEDQILFETEEVKVKINTFVSAKMMDPEQGFKWLVDREYGDLIKDTLAFPKGELTPDDENKLTEMGLSYIKKSGIASAALKKIMSDRLKDGEMLPDEEDGIKVGYYDECVVKEK